jgi:hypothetical protein
MAPTLLLPPLPLLLPLLLLLLLLLLLSVGRAVGRVRGLPAFLRPCFLPSGLASLTGW